MIRTLCITSLIVLATLTNVRALQEQELDSGPSDVSTDIKVLQKNITDLWNYIYELRNAMSDHLLHLKQHQIEIATVLHDLTHHSGGDHHHHGSGTGGEESHSHMEDHSHSHGSSHEHSDDHHHHDDHHQEDNHHHHHEEHPTSGPHSHDDGHHGQNKDDDHHHHDSNDDHHHHHDSSDEHHHHHEESNEKHDSKEHQQLHQHQQQEEVAEKVIVATNVTRHNHHHHHHGLDPLNILDNYHGHGRSMSRTARNMTYIPRISESDLYNFAICDVKPNTAIASELQQDVRGLVSFWQNKQGGSLGIHVRLSGFQMGGHDHHQQQHQHHHSGMSDVEQQDTDNTVSHKHGFHIHELGDLSNSCQSTGPHYVPKTANHGGPNSVTRHVGDLGNIECDSNGNTNIIFSDRMASLTGPYSIIGRSLVIHANPDDLGSNPDDPESLKTGNAGTRIACCIIQRVDRLSLRTQKSLKLAKQYKN